jgi:hypothetical protein
LLFLCAVLVLALDFEGARRFLRAAVFPVRGLGVFFACFAFFADFALFADFAFLTAVAFRALALALLSARTFDARASSSLKGSASAAAMTLLAFPQTVLWLLNAMR